MDTETERDNGFYGRNAHRRKMGDKRTGEMGETRLMVSTRPNKVNDRGKTATNVIQNYYR